MSWQIALAFFVSGFAGLMHEIVWSKMLAPLIGTTANAQAAVLAVYMGGLAVGSVFFGRRSDRYGRALRTYMLLEIGIAAYCVALPLFLAAAEEGYVSIARQVFESVELKFALRFGLAVLTILLPAVLMGGTLPLLARHFVLHPSQTRSRVAALYALNNFGAVAGSAAAGFVTLPMLGVYPSLLLAAAMNVVAAALVLPLVAAERDGEACDYAKQPALDAPQSPAYSRGIYSVTSVALLLSGFAAMAYEVVFLRVISLAFGATTYSFTVMLMSFITGIGLGSLVVMRLQVARPLWLLSVCQVVAAVAFVASTPLMERLPYYVALVRIAANEAGGSFVYYQLGKAALCLAVLLVPTMCLGASFPLVTAIQARRPDRIGSLVGGTYACNTVGNVLGVVVTSHFLLSCAGLLGSFHVAVALNVLAGVLVLAVATGVSLARRIAAPTLAAGALAVYGAFGLDWHRPLLCASNHLRLRSGVPAGFDAQTAARYPSSSFEAWKRHFVLDDGVVLRVEEESHASVVVAEMKNAVSLVVNTKTDASTDPNDMDTQVLLGHLPMFVQPGARDLLVVGFGSGITLAAATRHPVERADVVEISTGVMDVAPAFAPYNYHVLDDPKVHVYLDDAQSFLRTVPRTYDVIICEPSNPWISGVAGLFTREFFEIARDRLKPGGVFNLWLHEYEQSEEGIQLILRTFHGVFPHITVFAESNYDDIIAVGSVEPLHIDLAAIENRFDLPDVRNDLARIGIANVASLLSHHAIPPRLVPSILGEGPLNSILDQRLEYDSVRAKFTGVKSDLVERHSVLSSGTPGALLDEYITFRNQVGEAVRPLEIELAIAHMMDRSAYARQHREALNRRAERLPGNFSLPTRPARGAIPRLDDTGIYEARMWAAVFEQAGDESRRLRYAARAVGLMQEQGLR